MGIRFAVANMLTLVLMLSMLSSTAARAQSPVEIARRGKAATALLELDSGKQYATAFCVDSSGLFLTTASVLSKAGTDKGFRLILRPGQADQATFKPQVVWQDDELNLALLKVDANNDFATLALATGEGIAELMEVIAFGYPFVEKNRAHRAMVALGIRDYPATSINKVLRGRWKLVIRASTARNSCGGVRNNVVAPATGSRVPEGAQADSSTRTAVVPTATVRLPAARTSRSVCAVSGARRRHSECI